MEWTSEMSCQAENCYGSIFLTRHIVLLKIYNFPEVWVFYTKFI